MIDAAIEYSSRSDHPNTCLITGCIGDRIKLVLAFVCQERSEIEKRKAYLCAFRPQMVGVPGAVRHRKGCAGRYARLMRR